MAKLHLPVSNSRGGLVLPQLFTQHSIYESLQQFFTHSWHFSVLIHRALSAETILYLMVASTWAFKLRHIDRDIRHIAFNDIRKPSLRLNDRLHECRQNLTNLRTEVAKAKKWIPQSVRKELENIRTKIYAGGYIGFPDAVFDEVLAEAGTVESFLMETSQILMSSISVLDAETSIQQAHTAQKLTQLAFIYVPLSFVTSIFGMNVKEINGSPTPVWVCVVVLAITVVCTFTISSAYKVSKKYKLEKGKTVQRESMAGASKDISY